jgi:hypothetical protein
VVGTVWQNLVGNLAVVILFITVLSPLEERLATLRPRFRRIVLAAWLGLGAIATMLLAVPLQPGVLVDLRASMIVLAGSLGGPIGALIAGAMGAAYRLWVGGAGLFPGLVVIAAATAVGVASGLVARALPSRFQGILVTAVAAGLAGLAGMTLLPFERLPGSLSTYGPPLFLLNLAATIGSLYALDRAGRLREERHLLRFALLWRSRLTTST